MSTSNKILLFESNKETRQTLKVTEIVQFWFIWVSDRESCACQGSSAITQDAHKLGQQAAGWVHTQKKLG